MLLAEDEPIASTGAFQRALFEECAKGSDTGAGTDHDDVSRIIFGQAKRARFLDVNRYVFNEQLRVLGEEARSHSLLLASMCFVADDRDADMDLARVRLERGSDGIKARNDGSRSEEHTSELQSHSFISYA